MKIDILYEDEYYIVVDKPAPMLTHPTQENKKEKVNLLFRLRDQIGIKLYPIHRLDRPTSGVVIFAKIPKAVTLIKEIWSTDLVKKEYIALVKGVIQRGGKFEFPLKNENKNVQHAITNYNPIKVYNEVTLVDVEIRTGRRHQIRRHFGRRMQHVVGDRRYGKKIHNNFYLDNFGLDRLFLHAHRLTFEHPYLLKKIIVNAPLAEDLQKVLQRIEESIL
jgi:RluA family pseudouridine synthase